MDLITSHHGAALASAIDAVVLKGDCEICRQ